MKAWLHGGPLDGAEIDVPDCVELMVFVLEYGFAILFLSAMSLICSPLQ